MTFMQDLRRGPSRSGRGRKRLSASSTKMSSRRIVRTRRRLARCGLWSRTVQRLFMRIWLSRESSTPLERRPRVELKDGAQQDLKAELGGIGRELAPFQQPAAAARHGIQQHRHNLLAVFKRTPPQFNHRNLGRETGFGDVRRFRVHAASLAVEDIGDSCGKREKCRTLRRQRGAAAVVERCLWQRRDSWRRGVGCGRWEVCVH